MRATRIILIGLVLFQGSIFADRFRELGEPPQNPDPTEILSLPRPPPPAAPPASLTVNTASREEVRGFYNTIYRASDGVPIQWTGNLASCIPGTTSAAFRDAVALRINYFRAMAGIPAGITLSNLYNTKDQQAALMMAANRSLSHTPPPTWTCYTADGAEAAGKSNLSIGDSGPDAISGFIQDYGANNAAAGHRRWLLYPQTQIMGTGDLPESDTDFAANSTWILDSNFGGPRPATRNPFVSWPPPGYVPYPVVHPRWSFAYPNVNFSGASVLMSSNGVSMTVRLESLAGNIGDNTLVWVPANLDANDARTTFFRPSADTVYGITVRNVNVGGTPQDFTYNVTVFDPAVPGPDYLPPVISGPSQPGVNQANAYTFATVPIAESYQWMQVQLVPFTLVEGAENGLTNVTTNTSPGYAVIQTAVRASGTAAFHLAHPSPPGPQLLTLNRSILVGANSQLLFKSRLGFAAADQVARVQISADQGKSWIDIYSQAGSGGAGETSFANRSLSLSSFAGQTVTVRFNYDFSSGSFFNQTSSGVGWYLDDISVSNADEAINPAVMDVASGTSFNFVPTQAVRYSLQVRAKVYGSYFLEWGPAKFVTATTNVSPAISASAPQLLTGNQFQVHFTVANYRAGMVFQLERSLDLGAGWTVVGNASLQTLVANSKFRFTAPTAGGSREFYRVKSN